MQCNVSPTPGGSAWKSSLLSNFDKTRTCTGPHKLKNLKKLDWTDVNWFSAVLVGFLWLKDRSQPVSVSTGWGLVLWLLTTYIIENLYYWAWYYNEVIPCSVSGEGWGESVHHHPLSLPHCIVIIHPSPLFSSSAPLHHHPVAIFICCYCHVASS